ncbi:acyl-CoA dehydrogenase [Mycolicibacterium agri]|uniref:Acyl-CoA dehydrogenase n=1 Tax=Mycolicibacterium agri TaxID=36811 RepID=A0A2A7N0I8_MYCAG|nr:acyl-CoA dehydrogenase family protein [Mycolicibacterium agri]PEG36928.1 acyl-CoA dehydrogenase [Mycolicibacterium agri]GFG50230.1 putative acyl-CoA dehydrogenase [Mycolicibacterium agri]
MTGEDSPVVDLELLRASARGFLAERGEKESVEDLAAMDWTGLLVDESAGGAGWRPVEACVVAEELGRALDRSAWLGTAVAAAAVASASDGEAHRWLPDLLSGAATAGVVIGGAARVPRGDEIDILIMLSDTGIRLIEAAAVGKRWFDDDLLDVTRPVWRFDIRDVGGVTIGAPERSAQLADMARLLVTADSLGAVSMTLSRLTEYLKERRAFGAPIASFQAVQHRLVDLLVFEVKARAIVMKAARAVAAGSDQAPALAATAHAFVAQKGVAAVDECMQLSGGIGFTWEYPLHHELRRVFANSHLFGTARSSRTHLAKVCGW